MYSREKFKKFLFFDIETCGQYPTLQAAIDDKGPNVEEIFKKKGERLYNGKGWKAEPHHDYEANVALFPEFGRICCLSYGIWKDGEMTIASIADQDETVMLKKIANLFNKATSAGLVPTGWNIKNFDVSWVVRRLLINGIPVPECLSSYNKKPWEMEIFDMKDFWKSGSSLDCTFEEAALGLGIPTPKDDIDGGQVHTTFWNGDLARIQTYCEKDVKTMIVMAEHLFHIYHPQTLTLNTL